MVFHKESSGPQTVVSHPSFSYYNSIQLTDPYNNQKFTVLNTIALVPALGVAGIAPIVCYTVTTLDVLECMDTIISNQSIVGF